MLLVSRLKRNFKVIKLKCWYKFVIFRLRYDKMKSVGYWVGYMLALAEMLLNDHDWKLLRVFIVCTMSIIILNSIPMPYINGWPATYNYSDMWCDHAKLVHIRKYWLMFTSSIIMAVDFLCILLFWAALICFISYEKRYINVHIIIIISGSISLFYFRFETHLLDRIT